MKRLLLLTCLIMAGLRADDEARPSAAPAGGEAASAETPAVEPEPLQPTVLRDKPSDQLFAALKASRSGGGPAKILIDIERTPVSEAVVRKSRLSGLGVAAFKAKDNPNALIQFFNIFTPLNEFERRSVAPTPVSWGDARYDEYKGLIFFGISR